jgi:predicted metal-dependent HD superfamily phosphohydrolase
MLTDLFLHLVKKYSKDSELANNLWLEIFTKYSDNKRYYHNIEHLEAIINDLNEVKSNINDWDTILFAVIYHDIIYKVSGNTNEADSAKIAVQRLSVIGYPEEKITKCANMILATKEHKQSDDSDTNYLLDADLAILGQNQYNYQKYIEQIREEYSIYPNFMYNNGRKKVLHHFLQMEVIYKTNHFYQKYEHLARLNITNELEELH